MMDITLSPKQAEVILNLCGSKIKTSLLTAEEVYVLDSIQYSLVAAKESAQ